MKQSVKQVPLSGQKNLKIIVGSTVIGILAALVTVAYRFALTWAESTSFAMYDYFRSHLAMIPLLFLGLAITGYLVGLLTKKYSLISGSGIPQVKGRILGYISGSWLSTLLAKFLGGTAAIVAGLSLGREGPSIQLGACVAQGVSDRFHATLSEKRIYIASGASAGLAAAFNAPLAGVMFALEEIFKYFSPMVLLSTMVAAVVADFVSKLFYGHGFVFHFAITQSFTVEHYWMFLVLGVVLGFSGVLYNICLVKSQKLYKKLTKIPTQFRIIIPFLVAGVVGLTFPLILCGGHSVIEELNLGAGVGFFLLIFLGKFLFSMVSFGSGAPGGIFFPLLILGATIGALFAEIIIPLTGIDPALFYNFVIIAMAGYFTAIVRAPLTGIVLLVEMTGSLSQLLPLIVTAAVAYIVAEELHNKPIYESLLENLLESRGIHEAPTDTTKVLLETIVQHGSKMENQCLKDIDLPSGCLVISIKRGESEITPNGLTKLQNGDYLTVLTTVSQELQTRSQLEKWNEGK